MAGRVFISSTITDLRAERQAVKEAIEALQLQPVMAEDFPASPSAPQAACLQGVRSSDIYVGILGERYGFVGASGKSATEEEYDTAVARGIPILIFVKDDASPEPDQKAFIDRVSEYHGGHFRAAFRTPHALATAVVKALTHLQQQRHAEADPREVSRSTAEAAAERRGATGGSGETALAVGVVPLRVRQAFDVLELDGDELRESLLQPLVFGKNRMFTARQGGIAESTRHGVLLAEGTPSEAAPQVHMLPSGAMWLTLFPRREHRDELGFSLAAMNLIDRDVVLKAVTSFLGYAGGVLRTMPQLQATTAVFVSAALAGIANKYFGTHRVVQSMSMPWGAPELPDPLAVPDEALRVPVRELGDGGKASDTLVKHFDRHFRVAGRHFDELPR